MGAFCAAIFAIFSFNCSMVIITIRIFVILLKHGLIYANLPREDGFEGRSFAFYSIEGGLIYVSDKGFSFAFGHRKIRGVKFIQVSSFSFRYLSAENLFKLADKLILHYSLQLCAGDSLFASAEESGRGLSSVGKPPALLRFY